MDIEINKNGETYRLEDYGIHAKDFIVSSIPLETLNDVVEGRSGTVDYGANFGSRTITVPFIMKSKDLLDFPLLRDFLFSIVVSKEPFYIRERRRKKYQSYDFVDTNEKARDDEETRNNFVGGKRYKVRLQDSFDIDQSLEYGEGEFIFETTDLPFAESIGTTQDIEENGVDANDELWGFGMGLTSGENLKYTHNGNNFSIFNAGNVGVHPFEQELKIIINNVTRPLNYLELKNETNGSSFRITVKVHESDEVVYDGANIRINGLEALRRTNRKYIQLSPGWNNFKLDGADSAEISMFFRFYYL